MTHHNRQLIFGFFFISVSRHHQDTVSLNSYSNNKICSGLNAMKSSVDIYDTRTNIDCVQDTCDQTVYYPSIYATNPTAIDRLARQIIPNFLSTNNLTNKSTENNYQDSMETSNLSSNTMSNTMNQMNNTMMNNMMSNSLGALLNANTISNTMSNAISSSNCIHLNQAKDYDFDHSINNFCTNKNCPNSGALNDNEQMNNNLIANKIHNCIDTTAHHQQTNTNGCIGNTTHVYDIPHRQQQALNELKKLKQQMSTFRNVEF